MGPKKGRRVRKIEVPTDSFPEFELWDTAADIQRRMRREAREMEEAQQQREGGGKSRGITLAKRRDLQKRGPG